jgi:ADP-ribosyl-[dinitrogen reductase] hydrolase
MASTTTLDHDQSGRAIGCLLGLAIGDALGSTLEFSARDSQPIVRDLIGGGPFGLSPGQWTDDTSMALCLTDSLIACGDLDTTDLMQRFLRWFHEGENSVTGTCFDIGITTRNALAFFEETGRFIGEIVEDDRQAGNGSLMRLAPVAIWAAPDAAKAAKLAKAQSRTTHAAPAAHDACALFATMLVEAIMGASKAAVLKPRRYDTFEGGSRYGATIGKRPDRPDPCRVRIVETH